LKNNIEEITKLKQILKNEFPHLEIVTLENMTSKIAVITKVRIGKELSFNDYDEVSLSHLDHKGILLPHKRGEDFTPANKTSIESQSLNAGDILISYRGTKRYAVGRVGDNYKRAIVGNNGAIRIQFHENIDSSIPVMVHSYLELSYVQEYLKNVSGKSNYSRQLLSPKILMELPIPEFDVYSSRLYANVYEKRKDMIKELQDISQSSQEISKKLQMYSDRDLSLSANYEDSFKGFLEEKERINNLLHILKAQLKEIDTLVDR